LSTDWPETGDVPSTCSIATPKPGAQVRIPPPRLPGGLDAHDAVGAAVVVPVGPVAVGERLGGRPVGRDLVPDVDEVAVLGAGAVGVAGVVPDRGSASLAGGRGAG
jgi:hypothetical protein